MSRGKTLALGMGTLCVGIVGFAGFYLPFYSQSSRAGEESRRELHKDQVPDGIGGGLAIGGSAAAEKSKAPGGMWKNIERAQQQ